MDGADLVAWIKTDDRHAVFFAEVLEAAGAPLIATSCELCPTYSLAASKKMPVWTLTSSWLKLCASPVERTSVS
jgi:hypothetical protein